MECVEFETMTVYSTFDLDNFFEVVKKELCSKPYFSIRTQHCDGAFMGYKCALSSYPLKYHSATNTFLEIKND